MGSGRGGCPALGPYSTTTQSHYYQWDWLEFCHLLVDTVYYYNNNNKCKYLLMGEPI